MKIAVLGWGSLIWKPRNLLVTGIWHNDGPCLPVEFARVSKDGSLTLVLFPSAKRVQVLWTMMNTENFEEATESLKERENTSNNNIGFVDLPNQKYGSNVIAELPNTISRWAERKDLNAVIWTDLPSKFIENTGKFLNEENIVAYLRSLEKRKKQLAEEYIRKAPPQIRTNFRTRIEKELGWVPLITEDLTPKYLSKFP